MSIYGPPDLNGMATNLLKRLDALLDDGLVRGQKPLGNKNCLRDEVKKISGVHLCDGCNQTKECIVYCIMCKEYFCCKEELKKHYE
jgi:hypothetical protein